MAALIDYPHWLAQVNTELAALSNHLFSADDFDYPWIEKFNNDISPVDAAREALANDGFIVELLPSPFMLEHGGVPCPTV